MTILGRGAQDALSSFCLNYNDTAAFATQARKAARQLNVTIANHAEIAALLKSA